MNLFIADPHFGHSNIITYDSRPWEDIRAMDEGMIARWNKAVTPRDTVWVLGDFTWNQTSDYLKTLIGNLNGSKINLIIGNHDTAIVKHWNDIQDWFPGKVGEAVHYKFLHLNGVKLSLSHYPMLSWEQSHYGSIHLYGHVHNDLLPFKAVNSVNVSAMQVDYTPVSVDQIINMAAIRNAAILNKKESQ